MALVEVRVPDIGDFKDVAVIELLVKPGDTVKAEQSLITVESDKASMEIPSSADGVVKELKVALGDKVSEGSLLLLLEADGAAAAPAPAAGVVAAARLPGVPPDSVPPGPRSCRARTTPAPATASRPAVDPSSTARRGTIGARRRAVRAVPASDRAV